MSNPRRLCKDNPNVFCYICGELTLRKYRRNLTSKVQSLYYAYFGCAIGNQDKHSAPHFCYVNCSSRLHRWFAGKNVSLGFAVTMIWREQKDHVRDCYFCLTNVQGHIHKTRKNIQYPDLPFAIRLVQHSVDLSIPMPPSSLPILDEESSACSESSGADF